MLFLLKWTVGMLDRAIARGFANETEIQREYYPALTFWPSSDSHDPKIGASIISCIEPHHVWYKVIGDVIGNVTNCVFNMIIDTILSIHSLVVFPFGPIITFLCDYTCGGRICAAGTLKHRCIRVADVITASDNHISAKSKQKKLVSYSFSSSFSEDFIIIYGEYIIIYW